MENHRWKENFKSIFSNLKFFSEFGLKNLFNRYLGFSIIFSLIIAMSWPLGSLAHTFFRPDNISALKLTAKKLEWMKENRDKLTPFFKTDLHPFEFASNSGAFTELSSDIIAITENCLSSISYGQLELVPMTNVTDALKYTSLGVVDAYVENSAIAAHYIEKEGIPNFKFIDSTGYSHEFRIDASPQYPILFSAIQKAIDNTSLAELERVHNQWFSPEVSGVIYHKNKRLLFSASILILVALLALTGISYALGRRLEKKRAKLDTAQKELIEQIGLLRLASETIHAGAWESRVETQTVHLSDQWYAMLGYTTKNRVIPLEVFKDFVHPEDQPAVDNFFASYIPSGGKGAFEAEFRLHRADGSWCWVISKAKAIEWDKKGIPSRIVGMDLNIQNLKEAQEKFAQSEAGFRTLFRMAPMPLAHISLDGTILDVNDRLIETTGYKLNEIRKLEKAWDLSMPNADLRNNLTTKWRKDLERAIANNTDVKSFECPLCCADGTIQNVIVDTKLIGNSIIVSFFDITERNKTAEKKNLEYRQLSSILNSIDEIIYVSDPYTHEILFANQRLRDSLGKDPTGKLCYSALQGFDKPCAFCTNNIILNNGGLPHKWEYRNPLTSMDVTIVDQIIRWPDGRDVRFEFAVDISKLKEVDKALKESEQKLRSIFQAMTDLILIIDSEGRYLETAPTKGSLLYPPPEEIVGKTIGDFFNTEDTKRFFDAIKTALSTKKQVSLDHEITIGQKNLCFASIVSPISSDRVVWVARDITERKQLEKKFSTIFRMAPNMIAITRISDGIIADVNLGFEEITGWRKEEVIGRTSHDINFWVEPQERVYMLKCLADGMDVSNREVNFRKKDGTLRNGIYSVRTTQILEEDHILFVLEDVTKQKKTEEVLRAREAQFRAIAANIPGVLFQCYFKDNGEYGVNYISERITEIFGFERNRDDLFGYSISRVHEDDRERLITSIREAVKTASPWMFEGRILKNSGETVWFHGRSMPTRYKGQLLYDGFMLDVTEGKKAEEEKEKLQGQLLQSQKLEALGILAGGVAHDFNNMLGTITGYAELTIGKMKPCEPLRKNLEHILDAAQRSANLTRQLLAFARRQPVAPVIFDPNESIEAILKMIRRLIGENIELAWLPAKAPLSLKMDPSQFDQILVNLCLNARDAIADVGRITIETDRVSLDEGYCKSHPGHAPGDYVILEISDNGCGMNAETISHVFEPFFTTKGIGKGTGLGLATVYGIVKQNNGIINLYSEPAKGTTFRIYIPLNVIKNPGPKVSNFESIPKSHGESILIIEDNPILLEMGTAMLQRLGYNALSASTPNQAFRIAEESSNQIDLFITDVIMPEMNGKELTERLNIIRPKVKSIYMSGYTADIIAHHGVLEAGVNFIQKPFSIKDLAVKIRDVLD